MTARLPKLPPLDPHPWEPGQEGEPPVGDELTRPVRLRATSATERRVFRQCRRRWLGTVVHRLRSADINAAFWLGDLVHAGLESYYRAQQDGWPHFERTVKAMDAYDAAVDEALEGAHTAYGAVWREAEPIFDDTANLGRAMLAGYFEREADDPLFDEVLEVELRRWVPIRDPRGRRVGLLAVKADAVGRRRGRLAVADHKTAASANATPSQYLDLDDQLTAETYVAQEGLEEVVEEAVYNVLAKRVPVPPKRLKDAKDGTPKLSTDKRQSTTSELFRRELRSLGLTEEGYEEILFELDRQEAEEGSKYFRREAVFRTPGQLDSFERDLYREWMDMRDVALHPEKAYPSPSAFECPRCPLFQACLTMQDGNDPGPSIRARMVVAPPRY